jgi:hypothetical protein
MSRTFSNTLTLDPITALPYVAIYYNGQQIPQRTNEVASSFAKYYWELINNTSTFTVNIKANTGFVPSTYSPPVTVVPKFSSDDVAFIEYYYEAG